MKKIISYILVVFGVFILVFYIYLCITSPWVSFTEFEVESVGDKSVDELLIDKDVEFAKVDEVLIIPVFKTAHDFYRMYITTYSKSDYESVEVKKVILKDTEKIYNEYIYTDVLKPTLNKNNFYETIIYEDIKTDELLIESEKEYNLIIDVVVTTASGKKINKTIIYDIKLKEYKTQVFPT
ncbi:MAG: hypothetical protein IJX78_00375 [Bacilli bacterium]|nr:hypothetical protein [Bacilli bacterium]